MAGWRVGLGFLVGMAVRALGDQVNAGREDLPGYSGAWGWHFWRQSFPLVVRLSPPAITWQPYSADLLDQARQEGRPVILNFHADWCPPCLELEKSTLSDRRVVEAAGSFLPVVLDLTDFESVEVQLSPEAEDLRERFELIDLPTIVFINARGEEVEEGRVTGYLEPEEFVEKLERAWAVG